MFLKSCGLGLIGSLTLALNAWAGAPTLEGTVKDSSGRPITGADVLIQSKNFSKIVKTDALGHYESDLAAAGSYKVTLSIGGAVKASILNQAQPGKSAQLNFDLTTETVPVHKQTHMVWVGPAIGTHIGGGHWVEVDDSNKPVDHGGAHNVERIRQNPSSSNVGVLPAAACSCISGGGAGLAAGRTVSSFASTQGNH